VLPRPLGQSAPLGLICVHTLVCANRLLPIYESLVHCNPAIQWVFTVPPDDYRDDVADHLRDQTLPVIGWKKATGELQANFNVALAAASGHLDKLSIPVVKMAHGALHDKKTPRGTGTGVETPRQQHGLGSESLTRHGRAIASRIVLAHDDDLAQLRRSSPTLAATARVIGDPVVDQIDAHLDQRERFRQDLGVPEDMQLVVVTTTSGRRSLWRDRPEVLHRLMTELPAARYRVVVVTHPHVRHVYGSQLDDSWRRLYAAGMRRVPVDQDWIVLLIAADWVIGDHGSVLHYATRTQAALLTAGFAHDEVVAGSPRASLGRNLPELSHADPIEAQLLTAAAPEVKARYATAGQRLSSQPGSYAALLRRDIHRLVGVPEPDVPARLPSLVVPRLIPGRRFAAGRRDTRRQ